MIEFLLPTDKILSYRQLCRLINELSGLHNLNFQHLPYLESVTKEKGYYFEVAGKIHIEPMGIYSNSIKSLDDLKDGDKIGIPNNPSNEYRALKLLEDNAYD